MKYIYSETETFNCTISIEDLLQHIDAYKSHYKVSGFITYVENWKKAIFNCFQREANQTYTLKASDYFKESIFINGREFRFHFDILKAEKYYLQLPSQQLPLNAFSEKIECSSDAVIKYTSPNMMESTYDYKMCEHPIFIVYFFHQGFYYLVIDGNHRIAAKKNANLSNIDGKLLRPQDTLDIITSKLEKAMYLFLFESFLLANNDFTIINNSNAKHFI